MIVYFSLSCPSLCKILNVAFVLQPPFYSRDTAEMYDNILYKPLRLRTNVSASARSLLEGVSITDTVARQLIMLLGN